MSHQVNDLIERGGSVRTGSEEETFLLGEAVGGSLKGGEILLLFGDLGAGKTAFAKGVAAGLGLDPPDVTSPSFTLVNIHQGRLPFYHVDLYRLDSVEVEGLGLQEPIEEGNSVMIIEWANRLMGLSVSHAIGITFSDLGEDQREIVFEPAGE